MDALRYKILNKARTTRIVSKCDAATVPHMMQGIEGVTRVERQGPLASGGAINVRLARTSKPLRPDQQPNRS